MAIVRVGGGVAGGLALAALIVWLLDTPVPPCPPIATLPLRREPDRPVRAPEAHSVWREIERGVYESGLLRNDLTFTPTAERKPFRFDGIPIFGPPIWTLEEQQRGVGPWADWTTSIRIPNGRAPPDPPFLTIQAAFNGPSHSLRTAPLDSAPKKPAYAGLHERSLGG